MLSLLARLLVLQTCQDLPRAMRYVPLIFVVALTLVMGLWQLQRQGWRVARENYPFLENCFFTFLFFHFKIITNFENLFNFKILIIIGRNQK
jgi:hypothetical protein